MRSDAYTLPYSFKKKLMLFLHLTLGMYLIYPFLAILVLVLTDFDFYQLSLYSSLLVQIFVLISSCFLMKDYLAEQWDNFTHDLGGNLLKTLKLLPLIYLGNFIINFIVQFISGQGPTSENQIIIQDMTQALPIATFFLAVICAPVIEELLFRGLIFTSLSKTSTAFASLFASLLFGLSHLAAGFQAGNGWSELWYLPTYMFLGWIINRAYIKTESIFGSILLHFLNNAIAIAVLFLFL